MNAKTLTLAGAVVLIVGLFLPIATAMGINVNLLMPPGQSVSPDGLILLACAVLGGVLALINQAKWAVIPGIAAVGFLVYEYMDVTNKLGGGGATLSPEQQEMVSAMVSVNYLGWGAMGLGGILMIVGGAMGWKRAPSAV